ncbi:hypothetical protein FA95DRAFT_900594 [Auriscalpium vulgare]|uniref:Uncharacterized protein n=1 Tax=Auriscalpium vulgare TaxID=40419 RepID=A0ACB8R930_9AGAM|nr:hypothetical protein FA95DRAFT_900594 [Auriscalpium vulgare]
MHATSRPATLGPLKRMRNWNQRSHPVPTPSHSIMSTPMALSPSFNGPAWSVISPRSPVAAVGPRHPAAGSNSNPVRRPLGRHGSIPDPPLSAAGTFSHTVDTSAAVYASAALASGIEPGTYIAFALSKTAVSVQCPFATHLVESFPTKRYVGLVTSSTFYKNEEGELVQELVVNYVSPAQPSNSSLSTASPSVPIFPHATNGPAPAATLRTNTMFPWPDCHQWMTLGTRLLVDQVHKSSLVFALTDDALERVEQLMDAAYKQAHRDQDGDECLDSVEVQHLSVPEFPLPADVWTDLRDGKVCIDSLRFPDEVQSLERSVTCISNNCDPS